MRAAPVLVTVALMIAVAARAAEPENQCVACHEAERLPISLGHSFDDWRYSAHARGGVTCDKCHGGDPAAADAAVAHRGALPASDPGSMIQATRLAGMCGSCHPQEHAAYEKTVHAKQIQMFGLGATCLTCHGAMATSLPSPAELGSRCAVCHEKPLQAHVSLAMLAATKLRLYRTHRDIRALASADPAWHRNALERLHELERTYRRIQLEWHTFDVDRLLQDARDVIALAKLLDEEAKKHAEIEAREGAPNPSPAP